MTILQTIFNYLVFVPGLAESLLVLVLFCLLRFWRKLPALRALTFALIFTGLVGFLFWVGFNLFLNNRAILKPVYYLIVLLVSLYVWKTRHPQLERLVLPLMALLFALFHWQFTFVELQLTREATFTIAPQVYSADPEGSRTVQFDYAGSCSGMVSQELVDYLSQKKEKTVVLSIGALYHFGTLAGYSIDAIDAVKFPSTRSWSGGSCVSNGASAYPKFYFGLRSLIF
jgi:hypothetical protein